MSRTVATDQPRPILSVKNIEAVYNEIILVLHGISIEVPHQGIVALLGSNGAGKSTVLKAISGLLRAEDGHVTKGAIEFDGHEITHMPPDKRVRGGIIQVMEGRRIIEDMTVVENLRMGAYTRAGRPRSEDMDRIFEYFPVLQQRKGLAGYLSGGEQQMLAFGRALMARPKLILLDEPSMGLAPKLVDDLFQIVSRISREQSIPILLVEQNSKVALRYSDYGYIMEMGKIVLEGSASELQENEDVREFYLGLGETNERKSFKNLKSFKRRKRWM